jgi:hypothetical protein
MAGMLKRHRPSFWDFWRDNLATVALHSTRAEGWWSVALFLTTSVISAIAAFFFPKIASAGEDEFQTLVDTNEWKVGVGIAAWLIIQLLIINPARMWRNARWVRNVEALGVEIGRLRKTGTKLRHRESRFKILTAQQADRWFGGWPRVYQKWHQDALGIVCQLSPDEVGRFDTLGDIDPPRKSSGWINEHSSMKSTLAEKVKVLEEIRLRHRPKESL